MALAPISSSTITSHFQSTGRVLLSDLFHDHSLRRQDPGAKSFLLG